MAGGQGTAKDNLCMCMGLEFKVKIGWNSAGLETLHSSLAMFSVVQLFSIRNGLFPSSNRQWFPKIVKLRCDRAFAHAPVRAHACRCAKRRNANSRARSRASDYAKLSLFLTTGQADPYRLSR